MEPETSPTTRRVATSDDVEVSTYLEIAREKRGQQPLPAEPSQLQGEAILIIDFGSQYSRLIARRVRESHVYCEIVPHTASWDTVAALNPRGIILSGGPASVYEPGAPLAPSWVYEHKLPVLGICYGMQVLAHQLGGRVVAAASREYGLAILHQNPPGSPLFEGLPPSIPVWMSHGDRIAEMPPGFQALAYTENSPIAAMGGDGFIGLQFHPEVAHTPQGRELLANFLFKVCGCQATWTPANFVGQAVQRIREQVGDGKVICALSGGVDSAVTATLVHRAVGDQLTCVFVNNGLLRREEPSRVLEVFRRHLRLNLVYVDAEERFLRRLKGAVDPEEKRRVVGEEFIRVFEGQAAERLGEVDFLAQGTLYPDVIESQTPEHRAAAKIKTHHNVGGLPATMSLNLVEPLRYLFKDEVRGVGLALGLPEEMVYRQPFPGPGLAIRILGEVTREKLETLRGCDWVVMDEVKAAGLYRQLWQSFAVLTEARSVGVMGDYRTYGYVVAIRAVTSQDAMTADWARLPYDTLARISSRIVNEVPRVNRVVYDITSKPPGTIEWE
ncbi:MAG: glutamine-hydrolyzing GMP synthase [Chloroflexi bacterium]|nr:glutamine-hydrolyzing GMP synthase [Chloroflexota bacterium]